MKIKNATGVFRVLAATIGRAMIDLLEQNVKGAKANEQAR